MNTSSFIPAPLLNGALSEEQFEASYQAVSERHRGLIKQLISQLHVWFGAGTGVQRDCRKQYIQGFSCSTAHRAFPWALLVLDRKVDSPAQVVSAVMPPVSCGVAEIAVFGCGTPLKSNHPLVTGLELAGIELVVDGFSLDRLDELLTEAVHSTGQGILMALGDAEFLLQCFSSSMRAGVEFCPLKRAERLGVWGDGITRWDWEALRFAHPGAQFTWFGSQKDAPDGVSHVFEPDPNRFSTTPFDAVYVPEDMLPGSLEHFPLALGPGQEGHWSWLGLNRELLSKRGAGWTLHPSLQGSLLNQEQQAEET